MPHNEEMERALKERDAEGLFWLFVAQQFEEIKKVGIEDRIERRAVLIEGMSVPLGLTIETDKEKRAFREKGCAICGYGIYEAIVIHHIDKNPEHNATYNLLPLCRNCHQLVHRGVIDIDPLKVEANNKEVNISYQLKR